MYELVSVKNIPINPEKSVGAGRATLFRQDVASSRITETRAAGSAKSGDRF
jgi:hypothetical protein